LTLDPTLARAYEHCRVIARREAKNFYYAFVALPAERRNAICAIYAFMRKADDLSDDESISLAERRGHMAAWRERWRKAATGAPTDDLVFVAVRDAIVRFNIPLALLEELVDGTTMDLDRAASASNAVNESTASTDTYATFDDLYRYCYLVASVVGLVCIRIFGYADPRAEKLAEETGIAFQLTNILRDVAEDAARNRVYLPLDDLAAHGVSLNALLHRAPGVPPSENQRALLAAIGSRAEQFYQSAQQLLPLIDKESRPALWVLVAIYHGLLKRIRQANYDVFTTRASVPTALKLGILAVGMVRMGMARISG
jgi:15-cis-phytoene synthase